MNSMPPEERARIDAHVGKIVSFAALVRIKQMVHEWEQDDNAKHKIAKRMVLVLAICTCMLAITAIFLPSLVTTLVRSLTAMAF